jgi:hypothetical protein
VDIIGCLISGYVFFLEIVELSCVIVQLRWACSQDFAVAPAWILDQWQSGKIDHEMAIEELVRSRGRGLLNGIALVDGVRARQKVLDQKMEIHDVQQTLFNNMNPFRGHIVIDNWITQYHAEKYKKSSRFRSLLMTGGTQTGKSWKALSLWGVGRTLKVNCQGLAPHTLPSIAEFDRSKHCAILFDEIRTDQVLGNKEVFQAGAFTVSLAQSNCNVFCYQLWLYQVAFILCSNAFPMSNADGAKLTDEEGDWLRSNIDDVHLPSGQKWFIE